VGKSQPPGEKILNALEKGKQGKKETSDRSNDVDVEDDGQEEKRAFSTTGRGGGEGKRTRMKKKEADIRR